MCSGTNENYISGDAINLTVDGDDIGDRVTSGNGWSSPGWQISTSKYGNKQATIRVVAYQGKPMVNGESETVTSNSPLDINSPP